MIKKVFIHFLWGCFLMSWVQCAGLAKKPKYPAEVNPIMWSDFNKAETNYKEGLYPQALTDYENYLKIYPYNQLADEAMYKIGKIFFRDQKWEEAIQRFEFLGKQSPDKEYQAKAYLMSGYAAYKLEDFIRTLAALNNGEPSWLPTKLQLQHYSLKALAGEKGGASKNDIAFASLRLVDIYQESADPELKTLLIPDLISSQEALQRLHSWVISPLSSSQIPNWFRTYPSGYSKGYVEYKWAKIYYEEGNSQEAKRRLTKFIQAYPKHEYVDSAQQMLSSLGGVIISEGGRFKLGLLIPLSGPQASFGQAILWGVECALGKHPECESYYFDLTDKSQNIELIVRDSKNTPEEVVVMLDELKSLGAEAVIGPISGSLAEAAAQRAEELKLVLLPISQKSGIMENKNYIFQMGYVSEQQIVDLIRTARAKGLTQFGIFYPNTSYGQEMAELFSSEAQNSGAKITAKVSYDPQSPDFTSETRKLKFDSDHFSYKGNSAGFEALFIPDSYRTVNKIVAALEIVAIQDLALLGTNAWNDPRFNLDLSNLFPGSFFHDLFYPEDHQKIPLQFINAYKASFNRAPTSLEALGFDAALFIRRALELTNKNRSDDIQEALYTIEDLNGATRIRSFKRGSDSVVDPYWLTVGVSGIYELQ